MATQSGTESVDEFNGVSLDSHPTKLTSGMFQIDQGGDRFQRGSWRRRRGMLHSDQARLTDGPITTIIGWEIAGGDHPLLVVSGSEVHGFLNVTTQSEVGTQAGYGSGGYGSGGFGG